MNHIEDSVSVKREESEHTNGIPFPPNASSHVNDNSDQYENVTIKQEMNNSDSGNTHDRDTHESDKMNLQSINNEINTIHENDNESINKSNVGQVLNDQPNLKINNRQISGYVGFANLPKQWHRKSIRRGFNLNLLCVGKTGLGKNTLVNSLFNQNFTNNDNEFIEEEEEEKDLNSTDQNINNNDEDLNNNKNSKVRITTKHTLIEENGVRLKLTVIDTPGFGDAIDNTDAWKPIIKEINSRFDQYLDAENKINRSTIEDNRIHACLYFIEPTGHDLKPLDLEFCREIHSKCNLIPIIAKSDIMLDEEIEAFKFKIMNQLNEANIKLFKPPIYKLDDNETINVSTKLYQNLPYAVVGSNDFVSNPLKSGQLIRGREYPWGIIEVENSKHSDFNLLRDLLIRQYLEELRERTSKELYENYRSNKLTNLGIKQDNSVFKEFDPNTRQEEEQKLHEAKLSKLESEMKSVFQQKVSEKEKKLQKSETELFARHKEMKDKLTKQLKALEEKKHQLEISMSSQMAQSSPVPQKKKGFLR